MGGCCVLTYVDGKTYGHRMVSLGLSAHTLPALAFNSQMSHKLLTWQPNGSNVETKDLGNELNLDVILNLLHRFMGGDRQKVVKSAPAAAPKPVPQRDMKKGEQRHIPDLDVQTIEQRLRFVTAVDDRTFESVVMDESKDVLVYFYSSAGETHVPTARIENGESQWVYTCELCLKGAIFFNRCAERFSELGISSVVIAKMDINKHQPPINMQINELPKILFFPAFDKSPPHRQFTGHLKVPNIMQFVETHASIKFTLPELPHLDEIEKKAYWEQKKQMDENRRKMEEKQREEKEKKEREERERKAKEEL
eukprot:GDKI01040211.1.p1 GENE.GDKI01040211.1~~GDKI01040211.1.p1  ORF type:complete len:309 (-),score=74.63 GDKI01040211.1:316-1242(-)